MVACLAGPTIGDGAGTVSTGARATFPAERPFLERSWETDTPVVADDSSIELVVLERDAEPTWHSWLIMLLVPIAALCAVGLMVGLVG